MCVYWGIYYIAPILYTCSHIARTWIQGNLVCDATTPFNPRPLIVVALASRPLGLSYLHLVLDLVSACLLLFGTSLDPSFHTELQPAFENGSTTQNFTSVEGLYGVAVAFRSSTSWWVGLRMESYVMRHCDSFGRDVQQQGPDVLPLRRLLVRFLCNDTGEQGQWLKAVN